MVRDRTKAQSDDEKSKAAKEVGALVKAALNGELDASAVPRRASRFVEDPTCGRCHKRLGHFISIEDEAGAVCQTCTSLAAARGVIPQRYRWAVVESPDLRQRVSDGRALKAAIDASKQAQHVTFLGVSGSGKTSLAALIMRAWIDAGLTSRIKVNMYGLNTTPEMSVEWTDAFSLAKARQQVGLGTGEAPLVARCLSVQALVIDDLGAEPNQALNRVISEVVYARHDADLPTIVTSGIPTEEIEARYGSGFLRRTAEEGSARLIRVAAPKRA